MEKGIQNSHGARPVNQVIQSMWWTRTSRLSIKKSLFGDSLHRRGWVPVDDSNRNIKPGLISGTTFTASVYKWDSDVTFDPDIYIEGSSSDHFIFQITGNLIVGSGATIVLVDDGPHAPGL